MVVRARPRWPPGSMRDRGIGWPRSPRSPWTPGGEVAATWQGKELLQAVYAGGGPTAARAALDRFYHWADSVQVRELSRLAGTVRAWQAEILAFHATDGCSDGPTIAINLLIKQVKRVGDGFRKFANYRLRLLRHCGVRWQTHRTARLRRRPFPSAASRCQVAATRSGHG